jgi:[ribosomal protein S5]-alanine N-acetyltransferase
MELETLETPRLRLRPLELRDAEDANVYESDPLSVRYQSFDVMTLEESRDYIRKDLAARADAPRMVYDLAIVPKASGEDRMIGRAGLKITSLKDKEAMVWYVVTPKERCRGYATEATARMIHFGFEELGLHRIFADVDPLNTPSCRLCEKLNMRLEAHFIENVFLKEMWCDTKIYALLEREYRYSQGSDSPTNQQ